MKRIKFLLLGLLLTVTNAFAQLGLYAPPGCLPGLTCKIEKLRHVTSEFGHQHVYWFWYNKAGVLRVSGFSCHKLDCNLTKFQESVLTYMNDPSTFESLWKANIQGNCPVLGFENPANRFEVMCEDRAVVYFANYKTWLTDTPFEKYNWVVKANGTLTTRPAYNLVNGVRGTVSVGRATVGSKCFPSKPHLISGSDLWAEYSDTPGLVALCTKQS